MILLLEGMEDKVVPPPETERTEHLVRLQGQQRCEAWPLKHGRKTTVGRLSPDAPPDIDMWPDFRVSRLHACIWYDSGRWWIEDSRSRHGTRVDNQEIKGQGKTPLQPWVEVQMGHTILMLAPPHWRRLRSSMLIIDFEVSPVVNLALARCGAPLVRRLVARNESDRASLPHTLYMALADFSDTLTIPIPSLAPGQSMTLTTPTFRLDHDALERRVEKSRVSFTLRLRGDTAQLTSVDVWMLAPNEWSLELAYLPQVSLGAFVLPNHPLIEQVARASCQQLPVAHKAEEALQAIYEYLLNRCSLSYRLEPPSWEQQSQKIRFPHQVFPSFPAMSGQGACIDLALFIAACLEHLHHQPLIALIDMGSNSHALVGCWKHVAKRQEPLLPEASSRVIKHTAWLDPNGCTHDPDYLWTYERASAEARLALTQQPFLYALDVAAARDFDKVQPLPFIGELLWSRAAQQAVTQAEDMGRGLRQPIGTVLLWIALLRIPQSLTQELWIAMGRQPGQDADRLLDQLKGRAEHIDFRPRPTRNNALVISAARALAKHDGSPLILDRHLLHALLASPSTATDSALRFLGTSREALRATLHGLHPLSRTPWSQSLFPA